MTTDLPEAPAYFARDVADQPRGADGALEELPAPPALAPERVAALRDGGALVLDTRPAAEYGAGAPARLAAHRRSRASSLPGRAPSCRRRRRSCSSRRTRSASRRARTRLARVGLENVAGYLAGGIRAWEASGRPLASHRADRRGRAARAAGEERALQLLDVRRPAEWQAGHIATARATCRCSELAELAGSLDRDRPVAVVCASGYRSSIATSVLERMGFRSVTNVVGGMTAWDAARVRTKEERMNMRNRRRACWRLFWRLAGAAGGADEEVGQRLGGPRSRRGCADPGAERDTGVPFRRRVQGYLTAARTAETSTREVDPPGEGRRVRGAVRTPRRSRPARSCTSTDAIGR